MGDGIPDVLKSTSSLTPSSSVVQVATLSQFLTEWRSITSHRFVLNMVKGHTISSLGPSLCCSVIFTSSTLQLP